MDIGALIKTRRIEEGMKLEDLAKKIGVSAATVSRWESGKIEDMKRSRIKLLSDTLDIPVRILMGWDSAEESTLELSDKILLRQFHAADDRIKYAVRVLLGIERM